MGTGAEVVIPELFAAAEVDMALTAAYAAGGGLQAAGTAAAAATGMTFAQSAALAGGSQILGFLLAPDAPQKIPGTSVLKSDPTAMPEAPGPIQRARKEQDLMRKRTMGRDYTASLSDNLG